VLGETVKVRQLSVDLVLELAAGAESSVGKCPYFCLVALDVGAALARLLIEQFPDRPGVGKTDRRVRWARPEQPGCFRDAAAQLGEAELLGVAA
jgi:hypothetical protein